MMGLTMKRIMMLSGVVSLLVGCTAMPMPMTTSLLPGILPQAPPVTNTAYIPASSMLPAPTAPAAVVAPPDLNPTAPANLPVNNNAIPMPMPTPTVSIAPQGNQASPNLHEVADRLFRNETQGDARKLLRWNAQENFADLGLSHLIWYPANKRGRYTETFPPFLQYVQANQVPLPTWLAQRPADGGPWADKAAFERAQNDPQMVELRNFLQKTLHLQAAFMADHLRRNLPNMTAQLPAEQRQRVMENFQIMEKSPGGLYPILDYTLFQGDGANPNDRYRGQGWGLIQVLQNMERVNPGTGALAEFMRAANDTLVARVANAPPERREARLLTTWEERVRTYKVPTRMASR